MGAIDARLLPTPRVTLYDIEIGSGADAVKAKSLGLEFALSPLLRGEWRASEMHLSGPRVRLGLSASGRVRAPKFAIGFNPETLSIDRLNVEDGTVTLHDAASGASATLEKVWFNGEARSVLGPAKGEGAATVGGELYPFRLSTGRVGADGVLTVHLKVDPVSQPLSMAADGAVTFAGGAPQFDGNVKLARPVAIAGRGASSLTQPWHLNSKVKVSAAAALLQQLDFQYGSGDQAIAFAGTADFKFGKQPRFNGVLSGRQIDLDRAFAGSDGAMPPAVVIRKLAEFSRTAFRPTFPIKVGIGIDQVTLGGKPIQMVRGDISTDAGGWNLDSFEFHAPGFTKVKLSGHLAVDDKGVAFNGPAEVESTNPKALAAWIEGSAAPEKGALRPLRLRGEVTLSGEKLAIEHLTANFEHQPVTGRLVYAFAAGKRPTRLDAELNAPELDIDAALGFGKALVAGSNLGRPHDMTIAADIGHATYAGIEARNTLARVKVNGDGLQIDKLSIADLGGGAFSASGRIETGGHSPHGALAIDFETRQTAAIAKLVDNFVPNTAKPAVDLIGRVAHSKLHATLDVAGNKDNATTVAKLTVAGALGDMHLNSRARLHGDWTKPSAAEMEIDGGIDTPSGATLVKLMGLDQIVAVGKGPGSLKLQISGSYDRDLIVAARLAAKGLLATGHGRGKLSFDRGDTKFAGTVQVSEADLQPLRRTGKADRPEALPVSLQSHVAIAGRNFTFNDIDGKLAGARVQGHLAIADASPRKVNGELRAQAVDVTAFVGRAIGMPASAVGNGTAWSWSSAPFAGGLLGNFDGQIALQAMQANLTPHVAVRELHAAMHLGKNQIRLDGLRGDLAGGKLTGRLSFHNSSEGLAALGKFQLIGADAASLFSSATRPPLTGIIDGKIDIEGAGLSPVALIGSLRGSGRIALNKSQFARLDPRAFDVVTRAVDNGLAIDGPQISSVVGKALESGQLSVSHLDGAIAIGAGQVRLGDAKAHGENADVSVTGTVDLTNGTIDARLVLSGGSEVGGTRPDIFMALKGPLAEPARAVDISALTGWLTLRSLENKSKQLRAIESSAPPAAQPPPQSQPKSQPRLQPRAQTAPRAAVKPRAKQAPALPPPLNIQPLPSPAQPEASVGPQN